MKLELKHLAPYCVYGLKGKLFSNIDVVTGLDFENNIIETLNSDNCLIEDFKPILRPLSDLGKLGNENIPINEHTINMLLGGGTYGSVYFEHYKGDLAFEVEANDMQHYDSVKSVDFYLVEKVRNELLKANYDIFGLIPQGLAIDINTL